MASIYVKVIDAEYEYDHCGQNYCQTDPSGQLLKEPLFAEYIHVYMLIPLYRNESQNIY